MTLALRIQRRLRRLWFSILKSAWFHPKWMPKGGRIKIELHFPRQGRWVTEEEIKEATFDMETGKARIQMECLQALSKNVGKWSFMFNSCV